MLFLRFTKEKKTCVLVYFYLMAYLIITISSQNKANSIAESSRIEALNFRMLSFKDSTESVRSVGDQ